MWPEAKSKCQQRKKGEVSWLRAQVRTGSTHLRRRFKVDVSSTHPQHTFKAGPGIHSSPDTFNHNYTGIIAIITIMIFTFTSCIFFINDQILHYFQNKETLRENVIVKQAKKVHSDLSVHQSQSGLSQSWWPRPLSAAWSVLLPGPKTWQGLQGGSNSKHHPVRSGSRERSLVSFGSKKVVSFKDSVWRGTKKSALRSWREKNSKKSNLAQLQSQSWSSSQSCLGFRFWSEHLWSSSRLNLDLDLALVSVLPLVSVYMPIVLVASWSWSWPWFWYFLKFFSGQAWFSSRLGLRLVPASI